MAWWHAHPVITGSFELASPGRPCSNGNGVYSSLWDGADYFRPRGRSIAACRWPPQRLSMLSESKPVSTATFFPFILKGPHPKDGLVGVARRVVRIRPSRTSIAAAMSFMFLVIGRPGPGTMHRQLCHTADLTVGRLHALNSAERRGRLTEPPVSLPGQRRNRATAAALPPSASHPAEVLGLSVAEYRALCGAAHGELVHVVLPLGSVRLLHLLIAVAS